MSKIFVSKEFASIEWDALKTQEKKDLLLILAKRDNVCLKKIEDWLKMFDEMMSKVDVTNLKQN